MDGSVQCKSCSSVCTHVSTISTEMLCRPFVGVDGKEHFHDGNYYTDVYECIECREQINIDQPPHQCWCGWKQGVGGGYQDETFMQLQDNIPTPRCVLI